MTYWVVITDSGYSHNIPMHAGSTRDKTYFEVLEHVVGNIYDAKVLYQNGHVVVSDRLYSIAHSYVENLQQARKATTAVVQEQHKNKAVQV